ncbi:hypothetical protein [Baekduia sp. Peel2402]|uniref:hypothetical protein n=1 Tax=Baekduia sp. Peel2402 TaxID=3458296 RepID=UPI00403EDA42
MNQLSRLALAAACTAVALNACLVGADAAGGGLSVTPAVIERTAVRGDTASIMVLNSTSQPLKITVTPRPWTQSRSGAVAPNRHKTLLSRVGVSARSFTLAAGGRRTVTMNVKSIPSSGSLYGSVETIGLPAKAKQNGITAAYRLISTLRLNPTPARRHLAVRASSPRLNGRAIVLPVKNTGNTVSPISGDVRIKGAAGTRTDTIRAASILPSSTVNLGLGSTKGLPAGSYAVTVSLKQNGKTVLRTTKRLRVK